MAAPNLPTLLVIGYDSQSGTSWVNASSWDNISHGVSSPSGLFVVAGANSNASAFYRFTGMPSDFVKIKTLNYNIRYKIEGLTNDTEVLFVRVWDSTKTNAYTNEATVVSTTASIAITNKGSTALTLTAAGLAASKTDWDAALIEIRTTHSANMGADGSQWSIDEVELTGTYDAPPTTVLGNPADAASGQSTTPTLNFTATDPNGDTVEYEVQVDLNNSFNSQAGSPLLDKLSSAETAGFTAGHPFTSGVEKQFTVQAGDALTPGTTYYWRVRATDPSGSNTWGAWATTKSFTVSAGRQAQVIFY